jgi:acyl-CoA hydrolase
LVILDLIISNVNKKFISPVDAGSILKYVARVAYTMDTLVNVIVSVESIKKEGSQTISQQTNEFTVTFKLEESFDKTIRPNTYENAMLYLQGKRNINSLVLV